MPLPKRFFREALLTAASVVLLFAGGWYFAAKSLSGARWMLAAGVLLFALFVVAILVLALKPRKLERDLEEDLDGRGESGEFYLVGAPMALCASFLLSAFCLWRLFGDQLFIGANASPLTWLVYLFDNIIRAAALDFAESFHLTISPVEHTSNLLVCTLIFAFRTTVSVALISILFRSFTFLRARRLAKFAP